MLMNRMCRYLFPVASSRTLRAQTTKNASDTRLETCTSQYTRYGQMYRREHTQRSEEPPVLAAGVSVLQSLLDGLLGLLTLGDLLESVLGDNALETFQLESVASRHQVVVVDNLDERLDAAALLHRLLAHAAGDLGGVTLNAGDDGVGEGVRLGASVVGLDNDDLFCEGVSMHFFYPIRSQSSRFSPYFASRKVYPSIQAIPSCPGGEKNRFVPSYRHNGHG